MSKMNFTFKWGLGKYVTKEDLEKVLLKYYTKEEVDELLKKYATIEDVAAELVQKVDNVEFEEFKEEISTLVNAKLDTQEFEQFKAHLQTELDEKAEQVWVEQEVQRLDDEIANIPKPDLSNYYNKQEVDAKIDEIPKPDLSNYYNKQESDSRYEFKGGGGIGKFYKLEVSIKGVIRNWEKYTFNVTDAPQDWKDAVSNNSYTYSIIQNQSNVCWVGRDINFTYADKSQLEISIKDLDGGSGYEPGKKIFIVFSY